MGRQPVQGDDCGARVLDNLTTAVLVFTEDLRLAYLNPAGEMLFEISARKARGLPAAELLRAGDHAHAERLAGALASFHPVTERELQLYTTAGREVTVDWTVTPLLEPDQEPALMVEIQQVDRQLRISREEHLLSQQEATRDLLRGLAHEIKNPLGGLRGAAQLLERELDREGLKEYTRIIIGEADRLQNLLDRMVGPNSLPDKRPISVHQILEHVRSLVAAESDGRLEIARDYDPSVPELMADPDMLIQAVLNIVRNAAQAMDYAGVITLRTRTERQFTIGQRRHKLVLRLDIIDDGPGIPSELLERIFYPMVSGRSEGTGLGLSIAQSLVNRHGGLIECDSRPGRTVFTLLLPLEPTHD